MREQAGNHQYWMVSPAFDVLFIANVWWLWALLPGSVSSSGATPLEFWQLYFITAPHRWLTLVLVATDADRRQGRGRLFAGLAIVAACLVTGTWWFSSFFRCLVLVDVVWNAWHFASQHAGILRVYSRKSGNDRPRMESWSIRILVTYVILRLLGWTTGWSELFPTVHFVIRIIDWAVLAPPLVLLLIEILTDPLEKIGKVVYMTSVVGLYFALLLTVREGLPRWTTPLAVSAAAFHAVEYIAFVSFYASRRREHGSDTLFRTMSKQWLRILTVYLVLGGTVSQFADRSIPEFWLGLNLWAAFLHYTYDGMIWKLRRPTTASTLGLRSSAVGADSG